MYDLTYSTTLFILATIQALIATHYHTENTALDFGLQRTSIPHALAHSKWTVNIQRKEEKKVAKKDYRGL